MMKIIDWIKNIGYEQRIVLLSRITMIFNYVWSGIKIMFGVWTGSHFVIINGVFTLTIGIAKHLCIWGLQKESSAKIKTAYMITGVLLLTANIAYIIYMTRLFYKPHEQQFSEIMSITIAAFAFTSLTLSIMGLVKTKNKHPLLNLVKVIGFMTALTDIALTQIALRSMSSTEIVDSYNALFGIGIGSIGVLISLYMLIKMWNNKNFKVNEDLIQKMKS